MLIDAGLSPALDLVGAEAQELEASGYDGVFSVESNHDPFLPLVLAAEHDGNAPAAVMERMAAKIPGAEYVCLPGLGHLACMESPAVFNAAVLGFLRRKF